MRVRGPKAGRDKGDGQGMGLKDDILSWGSGHKLVQLAVQSAHNRTISSINDLTKPFLDPYDEWWKKGEEVRYVFRHFELARRIRKNLELIDELGLFPSSSMLLYLSASVSGLLERSRTSGCEFYCY